MKNKLLLILFATVTAVSAQEYNIKINLKGAKDTMVYLVKYTWDQQYIEDTCKNVKDGVIQFKGKRTLDKGVYILVSEGKAVYFDLFVNESQKFSISADVADIANSLKSDSKENQDFFTYVKFITGKSRDFGKFREQTKGMNTKDSLAFMTSKIAGLDVDVKKFEADFMTKVKGSYVYDVLNLKMEKEPKDVPKASNNRPDSIYSYYYYRNHFFDGVNFKDERIIRTPFFDDRVKRYFDQIVFSNPDTIITEIDKMLGKCEEGNLVYNLLLGHFTYKYEQSKVMGFDKIFVHLADKYIISGRAKEVYTEETVKSIKERVDIMRNLLLDAKVSDLFVIDTTDGAKVRKMGFDTASTVQSVTDLYVKNTTALSSMFKTLYNVQAKYTVLVFWAVDCGHCKTEIPKLNEELQKMQSELDFKVFAVQTKDDMYDDWKKFIAKENLKNFMHVYDPVHINDLKVRFDIYSTPVIYILDKDKRIKAKRIGSEQVPDLLKTLDAMDRKLNEKK
jgi:thiol-disulfide isomerase/thioredoxin